jgi:hypothetical protein
VLLEQALQQQAALHASSTQVGVKCQLVMHWPQLLATSRAC